MGIEVALLSVLAVSTVSGYMQQQAAAKDQKKARQQQNAMSAEQAARERRQQIREERIRRAKIEQSSENTGVAGGSGETGSVAGLSTQLGDNLGFNEGMVQGANRISALQQSAADHMTSAANWGAVGKLAGAGLAAIGPAATGGSEAAISKGSNSIFGPPQPTLFQKLF